MSGATGASGRPPELLAAIAKQCAERLIGCSLELGGKNPILVLRDADLEKAAEGAVRASFSNAGQLCVSMERMFVADQVYDRFLQKFVDRVNYFGQVAELDGQGRVLIHQRLRDSASMTGEVDVFGQYDHLEIWNHERFVSKMQREPFTDDDAKALSEFGI